MKLLKKGIAVLMIGLLSFSAIGCNGNNESGIEKQSPDTVIATVNEAKITKKAMDQQLVYLDTLMQWQYGEDYKNNEEAMAYYNEQKRLIIDYLVEIQVIISQASEMGIEVTDEDVEEELAVLKAEYETEEAFNEALEQSQMTLDELKGMLKEDLIVSQVINACIKDLSVTDEEVKTYYNDHKDEFKTKAGATMYHILVETEEEAKEVKAKYDAGTSFEDLAAEYGTDGTKDIGGLLNYIPYDSTKYDADFLAGAKALEEGEVSDPVKTQFGWHLIKVEGVNKEDVPSPFEEVEEEIKNYLLTDKQNKLIEENLASWKDECKIDINEALI